MNLAQPNTPCPCGSGKTFDACHRSWLPPSPADQVRAPMPSHPTVTRMLDLACGARCEPGYEGVDIAQLEGVSHVVDLAKYPWPFADESVLAIRVSHYVEHIPLEYVNAAGEPVRWNATGAQDALLRFFDECYRVLVPGGELKVIAPCASSNRCWQDPTHRRGIVQETFCYLSKAWREREKLTHYNVRCDFDGPAIPTVLPEVNALHPEAGRHAIVNWRNVVIDWHATLRAIKPQ